MITLNECAAVSAAQSVLREGGVILAPTETVYGLLCAAESEQARKKIYALKRRPAEKLLANFVPSAELVRSLFPDMPQAAYRIAQTFCPGPVTIVIPDPKNNSTFGFRIPDHPFILDLLTEYGGIIASTSANLSGQPPARSVPEALSSLDGAPDLAVDGGTIPPSSAASTVIQFFADNTWRILRPGPVTEEQIRNILRQENQ